MVARDGKAVEIAAARIAPGDVVLLSAGALVPADLRLLLLTGEAYRRGDPLFAPCALARLHTASGRGPWRPGRRHHHLSRSRSHGQTLILRAPSDRLTETIRQPS
jgi:hypothetical protein